MYSDLIKAIYTFDWNIDHEKVLLSYRHLIGTITSSNATFLMSSFHVLVKGFLNQISDAKPATEDLSAKSNSDKRSKLLVNSIEIYR